MGIARGFSAILIFGLTTSALLFVLTFPAHAACALDSTWCHGCGCKGGPGWRHIASGRCVGFRDLAKKCGDPPSELLCTFENAPGTGANRDCALAPAQPPDAPGRARKAVP